jgi:hypothetical protein
VVDRFFPKNCRCTNALALLRTPPNEFRVRSVLKQRRLGTVEAQQIPFKSLLRHLVASEVVLQRHIGGRRSLTMIERLVGSNPLEEAARRLVD